MKKVFIFLSFLFLCSCTNSERSKKVLLDAGFSDIEITGYSMFSCSEDDDYSTGFKAKNAKGIAVKGAVCCGIVKNCTIRFD